MIAAVSRLTHRLGQPLLRQAHLAGLLQRQTPGAQHLRALAVWLATNGLPSMVYAFPQIGTQPLRAAYQTLVSRLGIDAIVLVDGGTDVLMRGDESGLENPRRRHDQPCRRRQSQHRAGEAGGVHRFRHRRYHGVNHTQVLENIADLDAACGFVDGDGAARQTMATRPDHATIRS